jgi:hypothetical protein
MAINRCLFLILGIASVIFISCEEPIEFTTSDVIGTWVRADHGCVDTLKISIDNTYVQIYEDSKGNINVEEHKWGTYELGLYKYLDLDGYKYIYPGGECNISTGYGKFPLVKLIFGGDVKIMVSGDLNYYYSEIK